MTRGRFISVEGLDGAGKSTHLQWLVEHLRQQQLSVVQTREPGGTPLGEQLRTLLLNEAMHLETEALLMFAARNEHIQQVILPALLRGEWVLCDRFTDATYAYQCGGRGLDLVKFSQLEHWVQGRPEGLLEPDLTLIFDVPLEVSQARMANGRVLDRFEREQADFHARVRAAYSQRAKSAPQRIKVIDANRSIEAIQHELASILGPWLQEQA
ncbi:dTMP kinase [Chitinibacter tainanensis]|uniref:dTMP kinase n=1 Tax=Chitinibacter tainanensis TaxID=230667 RepID=UPI0003F734A7|nr:dTMP kinase [Chitinibacter tainanensis]